MEQVRIRFVLAALGEMRHTIPPHPVDLNIDTTSVDRLENLHDDTPSIPAFPTRATGS
jgi:hypothetical protein